MREARGVLKPRQRVHVMEEKEAFRDALVAWFEENARDYPWRRTREPYEILVSEVMLQQTQIATVLGKGFYTRFLTAFPNVEMLAVAEDAPLLKTWEGLGYYRRARMLRETARAVVDGHNGRFPQELEALMALPGIGRYTAGALRAFAFGLPAVLVDGNVSRVLSRLLDCADPVDDTAGIKRTWRWAGELADAKRPAAYHAALMELGQVICRPGEPDCQSCPVAGFCAASEPARLPVKRRKVSITAVDEHAVWVRDGAGRLLLHRETGKRRTGLWKLPVRESAEVRELPLLAEHQYSITRYRVRLRVHDGSSAQGSCQPGAGDRWVSTDDVPALAMAAPFRRVVERLLDNF